MGDEANEGVYDVIEPIAGVRDLCMESHFEYGTRAGWPRIRAVLKHYGVKATLSANGRALALSPWLAAEAVADGHEIAAHGFVFADDSARYCIEAFDRLYDEGASAPRMLSVGLHLRIIGRPGRIGGLERFLAHASSRPNVWFARRDEIARHWADARGSASQTRHVPGS